jgi:hypothetical protein
MNIPIDLKGLLTVTNLAAPSANRNRHKLRR